MTAVSMDYDMTTADDKVRFWVVGYDIGVIRTLR
jgi:hypothetical protein